MINRNQKRILLWACIMLWAVALHAQTVSNVAFYQSGNDVIITYTLSAPTEISVSISTNGGSTYSEPLQKVEGDVGAKVKAGNCSITWHAVEEFGDLQGNRIVFKVVAGRCPSTLTDIDGNVYKTVQLGEQCWMAENLRTKRYADGTSIPLGTTASYDVAYRYCPNDNSSNVSRYGYLYNWKAVMGSSSSSSANPSGVQGICPTGWHVPSKAEWTQLTTWVGSQSSYQCSSRSSKIAKALASIYGWNSSTSSCAVGNNPSSNNATGFSAPPAGNYSGNYHDGFSYNYFGNDANFWSATERGSSIAYFRYLCYFYDDVSSRNDDKNAGFSVRCVRD